MMDLWVLKAMSHGILLTGEVLHQKWNHFADLVGIPEDERLCKDLMWFSSQVPIDKDWVQRKNHRDEVMSRRVISPRGIPFERMIQRTKVTGLHHKRDPRDEEAMV